MVDKVGTNFSLYILIGFVVGRYSDLIKTCSVSRLHITGRDTPYTRSNFAKNKSCLLNSLLLQRLNIVAFLQVPRKSNSVKIRAIVPRLKVHL